MKSKGSWEMRSAQVDNKLSRRSAARHSSFSICQEMRAEQQAAKTHLTVLTTDSTLNI